MPNHASPCMPGLCYLMLHGRVGVPAAMQVNASGNDRGILVGKWFGDYSDGTSPLAWSGSGAILQQFWKTKRAVKYAQCWVFGGTLTSGAWVGPEIAQLYIIVEMGHHGLRMCTHQLQKL